MNELNSLIKSQSLAEWIITHNPTICCLQKTTLRSRDTKQIESERMEKTSYANSKQKTAWVTILISDKIDFKLKMLQETKSNIVY